MAVIQLHDTTTPAELAEKLSALRVGLAFSLRPYSDMRYRAFKETERNAFFTADDLTTLDDVIAILQPHREQD